MSHFIDNYASVKSNEMEIPFVSDNNTDISNYTNVFIPESKYIEATIGEFKYQIHKEVYSGGQVIIAIIGKDGNECVHMKFNYNDPEKELVLSGLSYKKICRIGVEMESGLQTVYMIKSLILYALQEFPEFDYVGFMEDSSRKCGSNNLKMDLAEQNYWLYGKTWYQRHFGAVPDPIDTGLMNGLMSIDARLNSPIIENISYIFARTGNNYISENMKNDFITLFEVQKNEGKTWRQFLYSVFSRESEFSYKYGFPMMCAFFIFVHDRLATLLNIGFRLAQTMWRINRNVAESYPEFDIVVFRNTDQPMYKRAIGGSRTRHRRKRSRINGYGGLWRQLSYGKHKTMKRYHNRSVHV